MKKKRKNFKQQIVLRQDIQMGKKMNIVLYMTLYIRKISYKTSRRKHKGKYL